MQAAEKDLPSLEADIAAGKFSGLKSWLNDRITSRSLGVPSILDRQVHSAVPAMILLAFDVWCKESSMCLVDVIYIQSAFCKKHIAEQPSWT